MTDPLAIRLTGYVPHRPHPKQHAFLALTQAEALFGGAAGPGKSDALMMAALQYVDIPGYSAILFRRTYADLAKPGALMFRSKEWLKRTDARWSEQNKTWTFPSGATLTFGYLDHPDHKFAHQSAEYQFCGFDELTQFAEPDYRYLFSRLRRPSVCDKHHEDPGRVLNGQLVCSVCGEVGPPLASVPLRMRSASNPGGRGHVWVRRRFIKKLASELDDELGTDPRDTVFIPARLSDNPSVDQAAYVKQLMHLDPQTRQQLLEGDWDAREPGACFTEFKFAQHTVPGSRHPDSRFDVYKGIDFGLHHAPCLWIELQGPRAFVFAEYDSQEQDLHKVAADIVEIDDEFDTRDSDAYIDPAGLGTNYQSGQTDAEVLLEYGINVANLDNTDRYSRESRTSFIKWLLRTNKLYISHECPYLIEALERAEWDSVAGGALKDCYRKDGLWEHPLDALGEALIRIFRPFPARAIDTVAVDVAAAQYAYSGSQYG